MRVHSVPCGGIVHAHVRVHVSPRTRAGTLDWRDVMYGPNQDSATRYWMKVSGCERKNIGALGALHAHAHLHKKTAQHRDVKVVRKACNGNEWEPKEATDGWHVVVRLGFGFYPLGSDIA